MRVVLQIRGVIPSENFLSNDESNTVSDDPKRRGKVSDFGAIGEHATATVDIDAARSQFTHTGMRQMRTRT